MPRAPSTPFQRWPGIAALLADLRATPGRPQATLRMVVASCVIIAVSMSLQVPNAALSAYMAFFVAKEDMAATTRGAAGLVFTVSVAIGLTLLLDRVSIGDAPLRLAAMAILFAVGMYLSRVFVAGPLGFGIGFILLVSQSTVDLYPAAEPLVRDTLWTWVALVFAVVVVAVLHRAVLPVGPWMRFRQQASQRLCYAGDVLARHAAGHDADAASPPANPVSPAGPPSPPAPHYAALLLPLEALAQSAFLLSGLPRATPRSRHAAALAATCRHMERALSAAAATLPSPPSRAWSPPGAARADAALLAEIEQQLRMIAAAWPPAAAPAVGAAPAHSRRALFLPDSTSNPAHQQFALKATLAAMLCYILYTGLAWPGIHTCVITCALVALSSTGATIHKAALRLAGALLGGALALLATVFVVPHLDSLGGLLVLVAPVVAASAWIATGPERTAYFGWQIAFAFFLCLLHGFHPSSDVTVVRDRLVGILLGTAMMALVFNYLWPERAQDRIAGVLARALQAAPSSRAEALRLLAEARRLQELAWFEPRQDGDAHAAAFQQVLAALHAASHQPSPSMG